MRSNRLLSRFFENPYQIEFSMDFLDFRVFDRILSTGQSVGVGVEFPLRLEAPPDPTDFQIGLVFKPSLPSGSGSVSLGNEKTPP